MENENTFSAHLEYAGKADYRLFVFETQPDGLTTVADIMEADNLTTLKRAFRKCHPNVRHIRLDSKNYEVTDAWSAVLLFLPAKRPE